MPAPARRLDLRLEEHEGDVEEAGSARPRRTGRRPSSRPPDRRCRASRSPPAASACWCPSRRTGRARSPRLRPIAFTNSEAHDARQQHADQRDEVGLAPGGARQAEEELLAVLDADGIEEEREAERADHRRRRRLRREPAHGERDEQHRAHAEREALDVDLADEIADRDREEQRHQRLLLEQRLDEFHAPPPRSCF